MSTGEPRAGAGVPHPARLRRRRGRAKVLGTALAYERVGRGRPVVFVPSAKGDRRVWERQVAEFAARYEVIRYDRRGYGRSASGPARRRDAEELAALLDALGVAEAAVVGDRDGGEVGLELAVDQPGRVRALVLADPMVLTLVSRALREGHPVYDPAIDPVEIVRTPAEEQAYRAAMRRVHALMRHIILRDLLRHPINEGRYMLPLVEAGMRPRILRDLLDSLMRLWPPSRFARYGLPQWADVRVSERLAEVRAPTLVVLGEWEFAIQFTMAGYLRDGIPDCEVVALPRAGHFLPQTVAEDFNRAVLAFLAARYGPATTDRDANP
jgi:pimeloyl-ACP methyl ester carboxylesterase